MARRRRSNVRPDINVTPLVDVVLVLLIIFMVVVPQMEAGAHVELAAVANADPDEDKKLTAIVISMTSEGDLFFERDAIKEEDLFAKLEKAHADDPQQRVQFRVDRRTRYAEVRGIFDLIQKAGYGGATLVVGDVPKTGPAPAKPGEK